MTTRLRTTARRALGYRCRTPRVVRPFWYPYRRLLLLPVTAILTSVFACLLTLLHTGSLVLALEALGKGVAFTLAVFVPSVAYGLWVLYPPRRKEPRP